MYFDMTFKDFTHLRWLSRNNSISGRTSFKTNTMFTVVGMRVLVAPAYKRQEAMKEYGHICLYCQTDS